ncbi:hypothetical protein BJ742DRAFT_790122 [Cladochytrium replicatum]|nr:hypothetical protein BJ742DRAFT_790122 [Cladochytrium replicatum]
MASQTGIKRTLADLKFINSLCATLKRDALTPGEPLVATKGFVADFSILPQHVARLSAGHFSYVQPEPTCSLMVSHAVNISKSDSNKEAFRWKVKPTYLIALSQSCADEVELDVGDLPREATGKKERALMDVVVGNKSIEGSNSWAQCYGGHQFGVWASQLGDGRAISLGEIETSIGERFELQLKGSGSTPYSRFADGYAVLRSSIREFLASESMHALGIPTSRALALTAAPERLVRREEGIETGAVVCRVAPGSWIRFGTFELWSKRGKLSMLRELAEFTIKNYFPNLWVEGLNGEEKTKENGEGAEEKKGKEKTEAVSSIKRPTMYVSWFQEVVRRTAVMIAHWQAVGFCHGVMNTDNFSILGLTIDYGPYQFMDDYDPEYICNHSDHEGRYSFSNQPSIGMWNLSSLGSAISPLVVKYDCNDDQDKAGVLLNDALETYEPIMNEKFTELMRAKLGLKDAQNDDLESIIYPCLGAMASVRTDYTNFFRLLCHFRLSDDHGVVKEGGKIALPAKLPVNPRLLSWYEKYRSRLLSELPEGADLIVADEERSARMKLANPRFVPRNYLLQDVIDEMEHLIANKYAEDTAAVAVPWRGGGGLLSEEGLMQAKLPAEPEGERLPDGYYTPVTDPKVLDMDWKVNPVTGYLEVLTTPYIDEDMATTGEERALRRRFATDYEGVPQSVKALKCSCSS